MVWQGKEDRPVTEPSADSSPGILQGLFGRKKESHAATAAGVAKPTLSAPTLLVDPDRVRVWKGNGRIYRDLNADNCRDLIDSIEQEGKQRVPAIARRVDDDPRYDFEVIAGTRRHYAVSWLKRRKLPDLGFLLLVEVLDDEQAFRVADLENRSRRDICDLERARNYATALQKHYSGHLTQMADRLGVSKGWLSKMVRVAALPDEIVAAFASPADLRMKPAYALSVILEPTTARFAAIATARQITRAQLARNEEGAAPYPPAEVYRLLIDAAKGDEPAADEFSFRGPTGLPALSVVANGSNGMTIKVHSDGGAGRAELLRAFELALATAKLPALNAR